MAARALYVVCLNTYEVKGSERHLLGDIENNRLEGPIMIHIHCMMSRRTLISANLGQKRLQIGQIYTS